MKKIIEELSNDDVIRVYSIILKVLRDRKIIRTNNLVGEIGEYKAFEFYNKSPLLPNLKAVEVGTKYVDAINDNNERYSIKATTTGGTGVFNGLNDKGSDLPLEKLFEYVIIMAFNKNLSLEAIYELDWDTFLSLKKWHPSKRTWYLTITNDLKRKAKILYDDESDIAL
ncbi:hypothetical protein [Bacillus paramycoides]|uniref:Uncharacterized protein n=1 Tax=Bacillus paramycoides TaxID=2026194 RepID=A0ABU6MR30_9BACI|nr:hypothetical protein [Bacillus paramycoides]